MCQKHQRNFGEKKCREWHGEVSGQQEIEFVKKCNVSNATNFGCRWKWVSSIFSNHVKKLCVCQWMPLEEFRAQPFHAKNDVFRRWIDMCVAHAKGKYEGFNAEEMPSMVPKQPHASLYWADLDVEEKT